MKSTHKKQADSPTQTSFANVLSHCREHIREAVGRAKEATFEEFSERAGENARLLQLVLNEAEGLAWQTNYPHLVFPVLADEKARATLRWHERQRAVRRTAPQFSFAE